MIDGEQIEMMTSVGKLAGHLCTEEGVPGLHLLRPFQSAE
jgi:hypothetical protein